MNPSSEKKFAVVKVDGVIVRKFDLTTEKLLQLRRAAEKILSQ